MSKRIRLLGVPSKFTINGEPADFITELKLAWNLEEGWALNISKDKTYLAPIQRIKE